MRIFHYSIAQFEIDFKLNLYFVIETIKKQTDSEAKKKKQIHLTYPVINISIKHLAVG